MADDDAAYEAQLGVGPDGPDPAVVPIHPSLRDPDSCRNCGRREGNGPVWPLPGGGHALLLRLEMVAPRELILEGRSCVTCVGEVYYKTRHLRDEALAGSGGDTPFHHAARTGNLRMVYYLIKFLLEDLEGAAHDVRVRALKKAVGRRNDRDETALHTAVGAGDNAIVELLMWAHPELGQMKCMDTSPIYLAVSLGFDDVAEALRDASQRSAIALSYSGPNGQNALHAAVVLLRMGGMTRMILGWNNLLAQGKDGNGRTPLHFAVSVDQRSRLQKWHPIIGYTWWRDIPFPVTQLLRHDLSLAYQRDNAGLFPVHVAAMTHQCLSIAILLFRCPSCLCLRDNQGRTFLHVAVQRNAVRVVKFVCRTPEFAPILNVQDNNGNTALHLAVDGQNLEMFGHLLRNKEVHLSLRNNESKTALDQAKIRRGRKGLFFKGANHWLLIEEVMFLQNPDYVIYETLKIAGAQHGRLWWTATPTPTTTLVEREKQKADDLEKESAKMGDSTRTLGIASVLIASVSFAAALARLPGGYGANSNHAGGPDTASLSGSWRFDAFMVADALAFICASAATVGLMYSGMPMVILSFRRKHFIACLHLVWTSVTCLVAAFALGVYMVLAPVAPAAAITIFAICPLVVICRYVQQLYTTYFVFRVMWATKGFRTWVISAVFHILIILLFEFWPFAIIFLWAAPSTRKHG
ncbi:hypothetical protein U9M48_029419 [Paspalum notatum var. saurae]|uniref:PGG domain-containing protein n=1 Tax=Paspalum notatum var. saurae TaxID=547442 RepID=A0AAQ3TYT4_PASNO